MAQPKREDYLMDEGGNFIGKSRPTSEEYLEYETSREGRPATEGDYRWSDTSSAKKRVAKFEGELEAAKSYAKDTSGTKSGESAAIKVQRARKNLDAAREKYAGLRQEASNYQINRDIEERQAAVRASAPMSSGYGMDDGGGMVLSGILGGMVGGRRFDNPEMAAEHQYLGQVADKLRQAAAGHIGDGVAKARQTAQDLVAQRIAMDKLSKEGEESAREHMKLLAAAYDEAEIDLASLRVDPKRWEEDTPAIAQVLMMIASSAFSFFTGGKGPNPVTSLIENAIERDMQAQMKNIENRTKGISLGLEKQEVMSKLEANIHAALWDRALNTYEQILKQGGMELQTEQAAASYMETLARATDAHRQRLEFYAQSYQNKYLSPIGAANEMLRAQAAASAGRENLKPDYTRKVGQDVTKVADTMNVLTRLGLRIKAGKGMGAIERQDIYGAIRSLFGGESFIDENGNEVQIDSAATLQRALESTATMLGRAMGVDVGNFAQSESKRMIKALQGGDWDVAMTSYRNLMNKLKEKTREWNDNFDSLAGAYNVSQLVPHRRRMAEIWLQHHEALK